MGIFSRKNKKAEEVFEEHIEEKEIEKKEPFVADISLCEFENVEWAEFGSLLKQNKILPNSYPKNPTSIDIKLDKKGKPMVLLTFNSATSDSVREYLLMQDEVLQSVNGVMNAFANQDLVDVWNKFKDEIRYRNKIHTNQEGRFHKMKAEKMIKQAEKMKGLDNIYELEQTFLETYKDATFDDFCYVTSYWDNSYNTVPAFVPLVSDGNGGYKSGKPAVPFSPKTLEHCILHMTDGEKVHHGEYVDDFEKMCRQIQKYSCFESKDWDKVIKIGKDLVKEKYQADILENGFNSN